MKIHASGIDYDVVFSNKLSRDLGKSGQFNPPSCEITIDSTLPLQRQADTLIHEIVEQINYDLNLELGHDKITGIASGIFSVLRDNPEVVELCFGEYGTSTY